MSFGSRGPYARYVRPARTAAERMGHAGRRRPSDDVPGPHRDLLFADQRDARRRRGSTKISSSSEWQCLGADSLPGSTSTCWRPGGDRADRVPEVAAGTADAGPIHQLRLDVVDVDDRRRARAWLGRQLGRPELPTRGRTGAERRRRSPAMLSTMRLPSSDRPSRGKRTVSSYSRGPNASRSISPFSAWIEWAPRRGEVDDAVAGAALRPSSRACHEIPRPAST